MKVPPRPFGLPERGEFSLEPERVPKQELPLGSAKSLADLGMAWWTPAVLYVFAGFTDRTLATYARETGKDLGIRWTLFRRPIFRGLETGSGDGAWNHALWATPLEEWPSLVAFLASLAFVDRHRKVYTKVGVQELEIFDPVVADDSVLATATPPTAKIVALGIDSDRGMTGFDHAGGPLALPRLRRWEPLEATTRMANAVFRGMPKGDR